MKTRAKIQLLAYSALLVSLFLPSKANEMTSQFGEHVKAWEPSIALPLRILFSPLVEWHDYQSFIPISEQPDSIWTDMWENIIYWLPITLTGWLFLLYPSLHRLRSSALRRGVRYFSLITTAFGSGLLIHHLIHWATLYDGYYHMGCGGYFLMAAYVLLVCLILIDTFSNDRDAAGRAEKGGGTDRLLAASANATSIMPTFIHQQPLHVCGMEGCYKAFSRVSCERRHAN